MAQFRVTPRARKDLLTIGRYTTNKWGTRQRNTYLCNLDNRFQWLADHPKMGNPRLDIGKDYYCYKQGSHLIFYTIQQEYIAIIGVPHQRMDTINYFSSEA